MRVCECKMLKNIVKLLCGACFFCKIIVGGTESDLIVTKIIFESEDKVGDVALRLQQNYSFLGEAFSLKSRITSVEYS